MITLRLFAVGVFAFGFLVGGSAVGSEILISQIASSKPLLTVAGTDPNSSTYIVTAGGFYDSVAKIDVVKGGITYHGTGSLIGGQYLLTAAHMLTGDTSGSVIATSFTATFGNGISYSGTDYYVYSAWNGNWMYGNDLAIVRLSSSPGLTPYAIGDAAAGNEVTLVGYGLSGTGLTGYLGSGYGFGTLRSGTNTYDALNQCYAGYNYWYDFDKPDGTTDTLGLYGFPQGGTGLTEVLIAEGDSGGPSFYNGMLVGVHSAGARMQLGDIDSVLNGTFGEVGIDTNVDSYLSWIDGIVTPVPEPASFLLLATGLAAVGIRALWRKR